jgi:hypothetical protein
MIDRLHALHGTDAAVPVVGAIWREDGLWILQPVSTTAPLSSVLDGRALPPAEAVGLATSVLDGLAALERVGLGMRLDPTRIGVDAAGGVLLSGELKPLEDLPAGTGAQSVGAMLCRALGVGEGAGADLQPAERLSPALVAAARTLARGRVASPADALVLVTEAAGGLAVPEQLDRARQQLAQLARPRVSEQSGRPAPSPMPTPAPASLGRGRPAPAPPPISLPTPPRSRPVTLSPIPPPAAAPAEEPPYRPRTPARVQLPAKPGVPPSVVLAGAVGLLVVIFIIFGLVQALRPHSGGPAANTGGQATPTAGTSPKSSPSSVPTPPQYPASAGVVHQVVLTYDQPQPCGPAAQACGVQVQVNFALLTQGQDITWNFQVTNVCTGSTTTVQSPSAQVHASAGWNNVISSSIITLPPGKRLEIVAVTQQPAQAASPPLYAGASSC